MPSSRGRRIIFRVAQNPSENTVSRTGLANAIRFYFKSQKGAPGPAKPQALNLQNLTPAQEKELEKNGFNAQFDHLCCPISRSIMRDPVFAADGYTYERTEIEKWLKQHNTSPSTGEELIHLDLTINCAMRSLISEVTSNLERNTNKKKFKPGQH